jgi:hypothetical protein
MTKISCVWQTAHRNVSQQRSVHGVLGNITHVDFFAVFKSWELFAAQ